MITNTPYNIDTSDSDFIDNFVSQATSAVDTMADARWIAYHKTRGFANNFSSEVYTLSSLPKVNYGIVARSVENVNTTELLSSNAPLPDMTIPEHTPTTTVNVLN